MQPLPLPLRPLRAASRLTLAATLLSMAFALPAQADADSCVTHDSYYPPLPASAGPDGPSALAVWVAAGPDPSDGSEKVSTDCLNGPQADPDAAACVGPDPYYPSPVPVEEGNDDDGSFAVWVAAGLDPSDGSEKVGPACLTHP
jgi:hypothetical protein